MYTIDYQTGITDKGYESLAAAKEAAIDGARYTQQDIVVLEEYRLAVVDASGNEREDVDNREVCRLPWWGTAATEGDEVTIDFGDMGFYGEWQ